MKCAKYKGDLSKMIPINTSKKPLFVITIGEQISSINPVDNDFLYLYSNNITNVIKNIHKNIKSDYANKTNADIISFDLTTYDVDKNKDIYMNSIKKIEIKGTPSHITTYEAYEAYIINLLVQLRNTKEYITLNNSLYFENIIKNIKKYTIDSVSINQYAFCVKESPKLEDFFDYNISTTVLQNHIKDNNYVLEVQLNALCKELKGVTNTYASELWLFNTLFQLALSNVRNVCVEMDTFNNAYSVLAFLYATRKNPVFYNVTKEYFIETTKKILDLPKFEAYALQNTEELLITVIHKSLEEDNVKVEIKTEYYGKADLMYFTRNFGMDSDCGISIGDLTFDASKDGSLISIVTGDPEEYITTKIPSNNGVYSFPLKKMSVAILRIPITQLSGGSSSVVTYQPDPNSAPITTSMKAYKKYLNNL